MESTSTPLPSGRHPDRTWAYVLAGGLAGGVLAALDLLGPLADGFFLLLGTVVVVSVIVGVRRHHPVGVRSWTLTAAAMVLFVVGGGARVALSTMGDLSPHRSLVPDAITLSGYLCLGVGLSGIANMRRRGKSGNGDTILDAAVAALAVLSLAWVFLITPALSHSGAPMRVRLVLCAYPPVSVFIFAGTAQLALSPSTRRTTSYRLLLIAMGSLLVGDVLYMLLELHKVPEWSLLDLPYYVAFSCFAATALHPSMATLGDEVPDQDLLHRRGRLAVVAGSLGIPAVVMATRRGTEIADRLFLAGVVLAMTVAATWRVLRALQANQRSEARFAHQATHDQLTGLPNQVSLRAQLERALVEHPSVAVLFVDLDRFKLVNDTYGHAVGDLLLVAVAERLQGLVRPSDVVARIGGDEFIVLLAGLGTRDHGLEVAETIRSELLAPFALGPAEVYATASIGVAIHEGGAALASEDLIRDADTAMYEAKQFGRDAVAVFDGSMRSRVARRLELEQALRHALDRSELEVHYQPIVTCPAGPAESVEALLRWKHPDLGNITPGEFIPIAEDSGLIVEMGRWVVQETCRDLADWRRSCPEASHLQASVNLSARQLRDPELLRVVHDAIVDNGLPPDSLCLELTESLLMDDPDAAASLLQQLADTGVRLSIDDFGTGYSSLAHLKRFPVNTVKIDRSFVIELDRPDSPDESLVAAIVAMAAALGMSTVAEGVETVEQARRLIDLGCDTLQGFLYCRPVPAYELPARLKMLSGRSLVPRPH